MHSRWQGLINLTADVRFRRRKETVMIISHLIRYILESKMTSMVWILDLFTIWTTGGKRKSSEERGENFFSIPVIVTGPKWADI